MPARLIGGAGRRRRKVLARLRSRSLPAHLAAIGIVLLLLLPWLDHGIYSADEGALLAQAEQLESTGDWVVPNPAPTIDPEAEALPLELAFRNDAGGWAPFHKNAVYVALTTASRSVAGDVGPLLLSVVGTLGAAAAAALLARRLAPGAGAEVPVAWLTAVGSPLLFDGYLYMAHALAAAACGFAAVAAVAALDGPVLGRRAVAGQPGGPLGDPPLGRGPVGPLGRRLGVAALAAALLLLGGLLRAEAVLLAIALGGGVFLAALRRPAPSPDPGTVSLVPAADLGPDVGTGTVSAAPAPGVAGSTGRGIALAERTAAAPVAAPVSVTRTRWRPDVMALAVGIGLAVVGVAARVLTPMIDARAWEGHQLSVLYAGSRDRAGGLEGRLDGFVNTWLRPVAGSSSSALLLLPLIGVVLLGAAVVLTRRPSAADLPAKVAAAGAALVAVRLLHEPAVVPGLLVAFPALVGVLALRRADVRSATGTVLAVGSGAFAVAVLATQYREGGAAEWGGRYFAIGIPLVAPLAVVGLARLARAAAEAAAGAGRVVVAAVAAATVVMSVGAVTALHQSKGAASATVDLVEELRVEVGAGEPAPILTTSGALGRFAWETIDEGGWYTTGRNELARYAERLAATEPAVLLYLADPTVELPLVAAVGDVEPIPDTGRLFVLRP